MTRYRLEGAAATHVGRVRTNNEDSFLDREREGLWVVADGMGGHEHGERASAAVVDALGDVALTGAFETDCVAIADAVHASNAVIWSEASEAGTQMGSTVVAFYGTGGRFAVFWVGDSRAYLLRAGALHRLTRDHTQVQEMVDRGLLAADAVEGHPMGHVLARAVGVQAQLEVDVISDTLEPGDIFLLCSDGLTGRLADDDIAPLLSVPSHHEAVHGLINLTLERGAPDNVTIAVVGVAETTALAIADMGEITELAIADADERLS